jgi:tellurite resistance protein
MISVANRVIAIGYQSVIAAWRVKAESRRVKASAFYRSTTQKRKPKFSTVRSTVGRNFDAKQRNSAQRTAKAKLRITWRQQWYATP